MHDFNQIVSVRMRTKEQCDISTLKVGSKVMAVKGKGSFADCFPAIEFKVAKINKKTFKTTCGLSIDLINIRKIIGF